MDFLSAILEFLGSLFSPENTLYDLLIQISGYQKIVVFIYGFVVFAFILAVIYLWKPEIFEAAIALKIIIPIAICCTCMCLLLSFSEISNTNNNWQLVTKMLLICLFAAKVFLGIGSFQIGVWGSENKLKFLIAFIVAVGLNIIGIKYQIFRVIFALLIQINACIFLGKSMDNVTDSIVTIPLVILIGLSFCFDPALISSFSDLSPLSSKFMDFTMSTTSTITIIVGFIIGLIFHPDTEDIFSNQTFMAIYCGIFTFLIFIFMIIPNLRSFFSFQPVEINRPTSKPIIIDLPVD